MVSTPEAQPNSMYEIVTPESAGLNLSLFTVNELLGMSAPDEVYEGRSRELHWYSLIDDKDPKVIAMALIQNLNNRIENKDPNMILATQDNQVCGYCYYKPSYAYATEFANLTLYIHPQHRKRRLGRKLLVKSIFNFFNSNHLLIGLPLVAKVHEENKPMQELITSLTDELASLGIEIREITEDDGSGLYFEHNVKAYTLNRSKDIEL